MLTKQEWDAMSEDEQKARESEMPEEVVREKEKVDHERLKNAVAERDRKLAAAESQVTELNAKIDAAQRAGNPQVVSNLENIRKQYLADLESDPLTANARLAATAANQAVSDFRKADQAKRTALRKLRKDYPKDMDKYGEELEDMLDGVTNPSSITLDSVLIMFNSLRGKSIDDQLKEAREDGARKALEDRGIAAVDSGGSSDSKIPRSSLTKEQSEEQIRMGLIEKDYKEILRGRQEVDKAEGRAPRVLISPKH